VRERLARRRDVRFVLQEPQLGTGHALQQTEALFAGVEGTLVLRVEALPETIHRSRSRLGRAAAVMEFPGLEYARHTAVWFLQMNTGIWYLLRNY
jgi:hypothetical protein